MSGQGEGSKKHGKIIKENKDTIFNEGRWISMVSDVDRVMGLLMLGFVILVVLALLKYVGS